MSERGAKLTELAKLTALEELAMPPAMPGDARLGDGAAKQVEELPPARSMPAATGGAAGSGELRPEELLSGSWTSYTS